jgi:hypothetical protein
MIALRTIKDLTTAVAGGAALAAGAVVVGLAFLVLFVIPGGLEILTLNYVRARRWLRRAQARLLRMNQIKVFISGFALALAGSHAAAQDWPQWRGPNRDAKAANFTAPIIWPKAFVLKWKVTVGEGVLPPSLGATGSMSAVCSREDYAVGGGDFGVADPGMRQKSDRRLLVDHQGPPHPDSHENQQLL